jgi:hypothetical protein
MKNRLKKLMQSDIFTSKEFNEALNKTITHGWSSKVTLDFLYVAESLGIIKCLGTLSRNQYTWKILEDDQAHAKQEQNEKGSTCDDGNFNIGAYIDEDQMTNEELNKYLAKFMGWEESNEVRSIIGTFNLVETPFYKDKNNKVVIPVRMWNPTESLDQMAMCVQTIPENKQTAYLSNLMEICTGYEDWDDASWENMFNLVEASPLQRAQAIYKTMAPK